MADTEPAKGIAPKKIGRPSIFTQELAERVCREYAAGRALHKIAAEPWAPGITTLDQWREQDRGGFAGMLARARAVKAAWHVERAGESLQAVDLEAVDARKANAYVNLAEKQASHDRWMAERLDRQAWGDRTEVHLTGSVDMRGTLGSPLLGTGGRVVEARIVEPEGEDE